MKYTHRAGRKSIGITLVEFGAALVIGLPLVITIIYAVLEASYLFSIRQHINQAAGLASRALAIEYGRNPKIALAPNGPEVQAVLTNIRIPNFVQDNAQFSTPSFNPTDPSSVTITCSYPPAGKYGLPPFPNPDPFHLGKNFQIDATATFATE
jgi:hypothetical protein